MTSSERGDLAIRVSTLLVLTATMLGLLVWYGSIAGGRSVAVSVFDALPDLADVVTVVARAIGTASAASTATTLSVGGASTASGVAVAGSVAPASWLSPLPESGSLALSSHRAHWEAQYMYGVSALAGLWVLARLCIGWRFDFGSLAVVPRSDPEDRDA